MGQSFLSLYLQASYNPVIHIPVHVLSSFGTELLA